MSDSASTLDNGTQSGVNASSIRTETDEIIRNDTIIIDPEKGATQVTTEVTYKDGSGGYKVESTTNNNTGDYETSQTTYDGNGNITSEGTVSQQDGVYMERGDTDIISDKPDPTYPTEEQQAEWEREETETPEEPERPDDNTDPEAEGKETECDATCKVTSFAVGLVKGAAMAVAVMGVMALAAAISPAVATAAGVLAIGAGIYGAYQLFTGWGSMSTQQKWETAGGIAGGLWAGIRGIRGPKQPKIPKPEPPPKPQLQLPAPPPRPALPAPPRGGPRSPVLFNPTSPAQFLQQGRLSYNDIAKWAFRGKLPNAFKPSPRFPNGFRYHTTDGKYNYQIHGHGRDLKYPGSNAANGPVASISRQPVGGGPREYLRTDGTWGPFDANPNAVHIPLHNSPF